MLHEIHAKFSGTLSWATLWSETRSKLAYQLTGAREPAGEYTSVSNFFRQPREPAVVPSTDVNITIDIKQKVARASA